MSRASLRFVIAYTFLVALPVMGLLGVLRTGKRLTAPMSVDGTWALQADLTRLAELTCGDHSSLSIAQSGKTLEIGLAGGWKTVGTIEGNSLRAAFTPSGGTAKSCNAGFSVNATLARDSNPKVMTGTLSVTDCPACAPLNFQATRRPATPAKGTQ